MLHDIEPWVSGIMGKMYRLGRCMSYRVQVFAFIWVSLSCTGSPGDTGAPEPPSCSATMSPNVEWTGDNLLISSEFCGELVLQSRVLGQGTWNVEWTANQWGGWTPNVTSSSGGTFEGLVLEGSWTLTGDDEAVFWRQGYQSWSWSGVTLPGEATLDDWGVIETGGDGDGRTVNYENDRTSWWVGALGRADGGSLLLGAQGATKTRFFVGVNGEQVQAVWGHRGEQIVLEPSETLTLDPLWVGLGSDPHQLHTQYADATTARIPARSLEEQAPTGWATWYQYYSHITEEDTRANLDALISLQSNPDLAPVDVFQIDDGWQLRWGDWWAGDDFPSGMTTLAEDIQSAGMTPGLWLAPFYMSTESATYTKQPDWWVLDDNGEPIRFSNLGTGDYVILDVTHPDVADWLRTLIEEKVGQGYGYLKLDFLYAGAMEGQRAQEVTGIEAYHIGMQILREAAGDAWILACGAPLLPTVGYAESFRTASDIAFESSTEPKIDFYRWQARSTAARAWTQGRWWWMDPDQVLVREPLTDIEVRGALASALVAGGTWMLGDDLNALDPERLNDVLNTDLIALLGQQARPIDPWKSISKVDPGPVIEMGLDDDQVPTNWELADGTTVLLNLGTETIEVSGPGGTNLLTGESTDRGMRTLLPGDGEVWRAP